MSDQQPEEPTSFGWRDRPGGSELWRLILEAFARDAS